MAGDRSARWYFKDKLPRRIFAHEAVGGVRRLAHVSPPIPHAELSPSRVASALGYLQRLLRRRLCRLWASCEESGQTLGVIREPTVERFSEGKTFRLRIYCDVAACSPE